IKTGTPTGIRTVTVTGSSGGLDIWNLAQVTNPDGGLHTFLYDVNNKLTQDSLGVISTTYTYTSGVMTGYTPGAGTGYTNDGGDAYVIQPLILAGLASLAKAPVDSWLTDPLTRTTRKQLDLWGRPTTVVAADGGTTRFQRDANGWITKQTDPLTRVTSYLLDT